MLKVFWIIRRLRSTIGGGATLRLDLQLDSVWEGIVAGGGERVVDLSPISTIGGEVASCVGVSLLTRSTAWRRMGGDRSGGRQSRHGSQPSPISTIGGEVVSYTSASFW
ncbi:hypothetical protein TIFTF001_028362 [Ficus carica]|uniref:Uncharacterized protein n=1 Tax=Ficus carica TaxID=3494 RepID=A0AA88DPQ1_FICCA|nr:hypothetical protein TIFTF001_028362 [Ficus carica]